MKHFRTKLAVLAVSLATAGPLLADDLPVRNCTWCHGTSAQGFSVAPRLAGQREDYVVNQLRSFVAHRRDDFLASKYMWNATANLDPSTARGLAAYFSALPPKAAKDGDSELVAEGRRIFENGVPDENIVACQACHGPEAQGVREIPRLGGLSYSYLKQRLEQWSQGYDASAMPMPKVARSLSANANCCPGLVLELHRQRIVGEIGLGARRPCGQGNWRDQMAGTAGLPKSMPSRLRRFAMQFALALALVLGVAYTAIPPAAALPSFARQTGQPCATCHTAFPQLTPYGRRFKLMGYTATGGEYAFPPYPPLAIMLQSGFTHTNADLGPQGGDFNKPNNWLDLDQQFSIFWGGKITDHLGAFVQTTRSHDGGGVAFGWDNTDIRYADTAKIVGHDVIWGLDFNNNPTVQDPWNTTSAWAWPFITSAFQPGPYAATLFDGPFGGLLGPGNAVSAGGYAFVDDSYYARTERV